MKKLFMMIMLLSTKLILACSITDSNCMHFYLEAQEMYNRPVQQQQYNNYNSGGTVYVKPDAWGAVVVSKGRSLIGISGGETNEEEAIKVAQRDCGGEDCKALVTYKNGYVAVVQGKLPNGQYRPYAWSAPTEYGAKRKTFKLCEKEAIECILIKTERSLP